MTGPPVSVLAYGFRPFFLLAGFYAVIAAVPWTALLTGFGVPQAVIAAPVWWHGHEMLFGFVAAVVAGFLLTAVPNWTEIERVHGAPLALLVVLWLLGRAGAWAGGVVPGWLFAVVDVAFLPVLATVLAVPLVRAGAKRNLVMIPVLLVFAAANLITHLQRLEILGASGSTGLRLGNDLVILLIAVIAGRVVPTFTTNALRARGDPVTAATGRVVDRLAPGSIALMLVVDLAAGPGLVAGAAAALAAGLNAARMLGWHGLRTLGTPILWVLHLGYLWIVLGLAAKAAAAFGAVLAPTDAAHALTLGAIGTYTLGMMTRIALGHTGRPLRAHALIVAGYVMISLAGAVRVFGPAVLPDHSTLVMGFSGGLWMAAWALFLVVYTPILTGPRADGLSG